MQDVKLLDNYDAVAGSRDHVPAAPGATNFLAKHQEALKQLPVAIFALGPLSTSDAAMSRSRSQLDKELEKYPWLKPVAVEMFVGKSDPSKMGIFDRLFSTASDHRDWKAIRAWANTLPSQLKHAELMSSRA
jgi:menaquinone-dependent protoporphyrinogen oxidase